MINRTKYFFAGLLIALTVGAVAQTGGLPSRPRFLSVGVGTSAPTSNGNMNVAGSVTASNFVGNVGGVAPSDFARQSQPNTFAGLQTLTGGGERLRIVENSTNGFIAFFNQAGTVRQGYIESSNSANMLTMEAEDGGSVRLKSGNSVILNAPSVQANGVEICRQDGTGCPSAGLTEVTDASQVWTVQSCTTSPTITPRFIKHGNTVTVRIPNVSCTANGSPSSFQLTGTYPTGMSPNPNAFQWSAVMQNNGTNTQGIFRMASTVWQWIPLSGGTLTGTIGNQAATSSAHMSFTYTIN